MNSIVIGLVLSWGDVIWFESVDNIGAVIQYKYFLHGIDIAILSLDPNLLICFQLPEIIIDN